MLTEVLDQQGKLGVEMIRSAVSKYSATNKTADSIRYESNDTKLQIFGRAFIEGMETGRGPRKSSTDGGFKDEMLEYMKARGIGSDLDAKKRANLAKFLVLKINREGDRLYKAGGGRDVYSSALSEFIEQLIAAVTKQQFKEMQEKVTASLKGIS